MANRSKSALQSRLARASAHRIGPAGMPRNPQDFSDLVRMRAASQQELRRAHWEYQPNRTRRRRPKVTTTFRGVLIDLKTHQFALAL